MAVELLIEIPGVENLLSVGGPEQPLLWFLSVFTSVALALLLDLVIRHAEPRLAGNRSSTTTSQDRKSQ